ncbi:MAG: 50S ribosomal protein L23 [Deltaproteobacteria bacterium]|nr:50S ribosomal protein L23 [Deltaproteobacteria bacterium]
MNTIHHIIKSPVITEKATAIGAEGKYAFWVDPKANKNEIKTAIEKAFNVKVTNVNTHRLPGKLKRMGKNAGKRPLRKKAYITLKEGDSITIFEGV